MKKGSLELTSREIIFLILAIIIVAVILLIALGFFGDITDTWVRLNESGKVIGEDVMT